MGIDTGIAYARSTRSPWLGCSPVSPGCAHCYARGVTKRMGLDCFDASPRHITIDGCEKDARRWNRKAEKTGEPWRVLTSMCDVFEDRPEVVDARKRFFALVEETLALTWLILTKRAENVTHLTPVRWWSGGWPRNAWLGFTAEDQRRFDERWAHVKDVPAPVIFVSAEPLLGEIDIGDARPGWLIAGGESGAGFRDMPAEKPRSLRDQCVAAGIPFWFKQWAGVQPKTLGAELDVRQWTEVPR